MTYVLIRTVHEDWLNTAVMGKDYKRAPMNPGFLEEIRAAVATMQNRIRSGSCTNTNIPTGPDPMNEILANDPEARNTPKKKKTFVSQVSRIPMPEWPEEAREGRPKIMRDVSVYLQGHHRRLWIHTKDLEWLVLSLWIHQQLKGVADVGSDDACAEAPKSMESDLTPEKCPRPQEDAANLYSKWADAP